MFLQVREVPRFLLTQRAETFLDGSLPFWRLRLQQFTYDYAKCFIFAVLGIIGFNFVLPEFLSAGQLGSWLRGHRHRAFPNPSQRVLPSASPIRSNSFLNFPFSYQRIRSVLAVFVFPSCFSDRTSGVYSFVSRAWTLFFNMVLMDGGRSCIVISSKASPAGVRGLSCGVASTIISSAFPD